MFSIDVNSTHERRRTRNLGELKQLFPDGGAKSESNPNFLLFFQENCSNLEYFSSTRGLQLFLLSMPMSLPTPFLFILYQNI